METFEQKAARAVRRHLASRRLDAAGAAVRNWQARTPDSAAALAFSGLISLFSGDATRARDQIAAALRADQRCAPAYFTLGVLYLRDGKLDEAEPCLRRAAAIDPSDCETARCLAEIRARIGDFGDAEGLLRAAITRDPEDALNYVALGTLLFRLGAVTEELHRLCELAVSRGRELGVVWMLKARVTAAGGQFDESRDSIEQALLCEPEDPTAHMEYARICLVSGDAETAAQRAKTACGMMPGAIQPLLIYAAALRASRDFHQAREAVSEAIRLGPDDPLVLLEQARLFIETDASEQACATLEAVIARLPTEPIVLSAYMDWCLRVGSLRRAFDMADRLDKAMRPGALRLERTALTDAAPRQPIVVFGNSMKDLVNGARFLDLMPAGIIVRVACTPALAPMMRRVKGVTDVVTTRSALQGVHVEPINRIAWLCNVDEQTPVYRGPYLYASASIVASLRESLSLRSGPIILIDLGPRPQPQIVEGIMSALATRRAVIALLNPILELQCATPELEVINLDTSDIETLTAWLHLARERIFVDSPFAMIAGAMGLRSRLLVELGSDGVWGERGEGSDWYPDITLYRETVEAGWSDALSRLTQHVAIALTADDTSHCAASIVDP